jgi:hypothetical protein
VKLTQDNYYSQRANRAYFSVSQFKAFRECEAAAMAELRGEYKPQRGRALLLGSYVDEMLTGTYESQKKFILENESDLFKKNGDLYADVLQAAETVERVRAQPLMMKYLDGEHQTIMTGEIEGVPFKIKMDCYRPGEFITDLKYMASLRSPNLFESFVSYWGYDLQAAVYQEIVYQNTLKRLPFIFVVPTKEQPARLAVGEINQWNMDKALERVKKDIRRYQSVKTGEIEPRRCEGYECDYCASTVILTEVIDTDLFGMSRKQLNSMEGVL